VLLLSGAQPAASARSSKRALKFFFGVWPASLRSGWQINALPAPDLRVHRLCGVRPALKPGARRIRATDLFRNVRALLPRFVACAILA